MNNKRQNQSARLVRSRAVYDSDKERLRRENALLIEDSKISAVGMFDDLFEKNREAEILDLSDCYLFPGLINTHVHLEFDASEDPRRTFLQEDDYVRFARAAENARIMLRSGVTTVRDAGSTWGMLSLLKLRENGLFLLPRLQLAGPALTITGGHLNFLGDELDTTDELIKSVRLHHKHGCGAIKIVATGGQMTPGSGPERTCYTAQQIRAVTDEAHHLGLSTFAHCLTTEGLVNCVRGGVQSIEHAACFRRNPGNMLLERVYDSDAMEQFRGKHPYFMQAITSLYHVLDPYRKGKIPCTARETFLLKQEDHMAEIFLRLCDLGFVPSLGTDAGVAMTYFDETWFELSVLCERTGISEKSAIRIATVNSAASLGLGDVTGKLAEGFSADIVALRSNPLDNIRAFSDVWHVICEGKSVTS